MSKHEIRLRRQKMTSHGAERYRNYGAVLQRHEQEKRLKKIVRVFGYFLIILILVMLIVIVTRVEKKAVKPVEPKGQISMDIPEVKSAFHPCTGITAGAG